MDLPKFVIEHWQLIKTNLGLFIAFAFLALGIAWLAVKTLYKERIETLKERIASKDDQIKYYKDLSEAKQIPNNPVINDERIKANNVKDDILREIQFLEHNTGKAIAVQLFDRLQLKYSFVVILSELQTMNANNELTWAEAPKPPEALSAIKVLR